MTKILDLQGLEVPAEHAAVPMSFISTNPHLLVAAPVETEE